jgi:glycosyltransferase involved in cell wall biosynthesis
MSVVIPTRDQCGFLAVAIESVLRSAVITSSAQVIVIDDDSRDDTAEVALRYGVTYRHVVNHNISLSRNAGLALVTTPYVTFLDHDDVWLPGNMEAQLRALESHPSAAFAYGITRCASEALEPLPWTYPAAPLPSGIVPDRLHLGYPQLGVVLFRREAVTAVGGFDPAIPYHQDGDLMIRIAARQPIIGVEVVGALHRLRAPSRSRADYLWGFRSTATWRPREVGVRWRTHARYMAGRRQLFFHRFLEDAGACAAGGERRNALTCLSRAVWASPPHVVRHAPRVASTVRHTLHR